MSLDVVLLLVRIGIALALYAFLALILVYLIQDVRRASQEAALGQRSPARLVVVQADGVDVEVGREYPLQPTTRLGRGPTNTIVLPDTFASTHHAQVVLRRDQWWLEDQRSRNGTTLNGIPVTGAVVLSSGDEIGIGRVRLRLELG
jgi:pSer/pThr/pTyr-binding forkhead associated (FHA) protein